MDALSVTPLSSHSTTFYHTRRLCRRLAFMARSPGTPTAFYRIAAGHVADLAIPVVILFNTGLLEKTPLLMVCSASLHQPLTGRFGH